MARLALAVAGAVAIGASFKGLELAIAICGHHVQNLAMEGAPSVGALILCKLGLRRRRIAPPFARLARIKLGSRPAE
jgi:hypothetical protein